MHKISVLLLSILLISLTGCEDKKPDESTIPIENTTEFVSQTQHDTACDTKFKVTQPTHTQNSPLTSVDTPKIIPSAHTFILLNTKSKSRKITFSEDKLIIQPNTKPIVLLNLFATWCPPCIGEFSDFNRLQKKYKNDLVLLGVLTHDYIDISTLESFIAKHEMNYFVSNSPHNNAFGSRLASTLHLPQNYPIPLTVMYVNGKYFTHYEGTVPVEMIEYDIQQAQKQLKLKSN